MSFAAAAGVAALALAAALALRLSGRLLPRNEREREK